MKVICETNMKELPQTCGKCRFSEVEHKINGYGDADETSRTCYLKNKKEIPLVYNKKKNKSSYDRPKWCPLKLLNNG